jgi:clan AA aspartic protease
MIRGFVNENDEPLVPIALLLKNKPRRFQAVLDTGFNGYLSVPEAIVRRSGWYFAGYEEYEIATGDRVRERVYLGEVVFDRRRFTTHVVTSRAEDILMGTRLLSDRTLHIDFKRRLVWIR